MYNIVLRRYWIPDDELVGLMRSDQDFRRYLRNDGRYLRNDGRTKPESTVIPSVAVDVVSCSSSSSVEKIPSTCSPVDHADVVSIVQENENQAPLVAAPTTETTSTTEGPIPTTATRQRTSDGAGSTYPFDGLSTKEARQQWLSQNTDGDGSRTMFFHLPDAHSLAEQTSNKTPCPYHQKSYCRDCEFVGRRAIATASTTPIDYVFELLHSREMLHGLQCSEPRAPVRTLSEIFTKHCVVGMDVLKLDVEGADVAILRELCGNYFSSLGLLGLPRKIIFEARREFGAEALEMV